MFSCGLFDPCQVLTGEIDRVDDPATLYKHEVRKVKFGRKKNYFTWQMWSIFAKIVTLWVHSPSFDQYYNDQEKEMPPTEKALCYLASPLDWQSYGLPKPARDTTVFEHLTFLLTSNKVQRRNVIAAIDQFFTNPKRRVHAYGLAIVNRWTRLHDLGDLPGE